ncbi:hypothetical protein VCRA2120O333_20458 [Vibrio crassostreae]|nr:hypothetical protein VCRA2121O334_20460 [Vibrio crassostreae]CAK3651346.1 hypothetical protein VCRA2122O341_70085 [Vibrio crassostreae]CAK3878004.1 hypothetical protein VCRA2120O333_20458 [Vibrio crassostreae]
MHPVVEVIKFSSILDLHLNNTNMVTIRGVMICELDRVVVIKPLFTKGYKVELIQ